MAKIISNFHNKVLAQWQLYYILLNVQSMCITFGISFGMQSAYTLGLARDLEEF